MQPDARETAFGNHGPGFISGVIYSLPRHDALAFDLPASLGIFKKGLKFRFISVIVETSGVFVFPCRFFPER